MVSSVVSKLLLTAVACLLVLTGCQQDEEQSASLFVFGTIVEIKLWGVTEEQGNRVFAEIQQLFHAMHRDLHAWEPGRLTEINNAFTQGQPATADEDIVAIVRQSQWIEERTGGRFNPAIGALIRLWGFHTSDYPIIGPPPAQKQISALLESRPSSRDIHIDGLQLRSDNPVVQLDFGGIAKGYAVDLAIGHLQQRGITNAIVNAGGDLRAMGHHGDRSWRVAVKRPAGGNIGTVEVRGDEAVFTSGNYARFRQDEQERYPHILDPHSGWPAQDVASVTVITDKGLLADAASTALVVAGLEGWPAVARALGLDQVAVVDESGTVHLTPEMAKRIHFTGDVVRVIVPIDEHSGEE